jgi:hypothetical protein
MRRAAWPPTRLRTEEIHQPGQAGWLQPWTVILNAPLSKEIACDRQLARQIILSEGVWLFGVCDTEASPSP